MQAAKPSGQVEVSKAFSTVNENKTQDGFVLFDAPVSAYISRRGYDSILIVVL